MSQLVLFVISTLAVWRAVLLIVEDEGPFGVFAWLRDRIDPQQATWMGRGWNCQWCVSWWAGAVASIWLWYFGWVDGSLIPLWWFGLSGGSILFSNFTVWQARRR